jgi:hypothetical protein
MVRDLGVSMTIKIQVQVFWVVTPSSDVVGYPEDGGGTVITNLLTPWSRFLLDTVKITQLIKKFPAFYGTRKFITPYTGAHQIRGPV